MAAIQDYAIIGDGRSAALVSRSGSVDWLAWPRFDSPSIFGALLDEAKGGRWTLRPAGPSDVERRYVEGTNVLVTRHRTGTGVLEVTDLMPVASEEEKDEILLPEYELIRIVRCTEGEVAIESVFHPRPDYGRRRARLQQKSWFGVRAEIGSWALYGYRSTAPVAVQGGEVAVTRTTLQAGDEHFFSLTYENDAPACLPPLRHHVPESVERSIRWWRDWSGRADYEGPHREAVLRSLLALKLLAYAPSGALVAAATTSLPEKPGGSLNWDYRYCWVRDASFTVRVFLELGYVAEARAFVSWLLHTTRLTRPKMRTLYDVFGRVPKQEHELPHLAGYQGARPVRVGNAAGDQRQMDSYGEVIDAAWQLAVRAERLDAEAGVMLREMGAYVADNWRQPDQGIWEPRGPPQDHTHSRMLCWVALQRLVDLHERGLLRKVPADDWREEMRRIREDVETRGWSEKLQSYTGVYGEDQVDAAVLLAGWYGFHPPDHPRLTKTWERIRERLGVGGGLLYRYEKSKQNGEGAFGICSFWAADHVARAYGDVGEARTWFEGTLSHASDLGLLSEEVDPENGEALGNFPQAFSHVGLVNAALSMREAAEGRRHTRREEQGGSPEEGEAQERRTPREDRQEAGA